MISRVNHAPEHFEGPEQLLAWYKKFRWYHARLARLVAQFLEWHVEQFAKEERTQAHLGDGSEDSSIHHLPVLAKITYRDKRMSSLAANLQVVGQRYSALNRDALADLAGVRIVFYFNEDLQSFCKRKNQFIDWFGQFSGENLELKTPRVARGREGTSTDYESWHLKIRVSEGNRFYNSLTSVDQEFLQGLYCEVQLRTVLQDAWAEADHEIRYKISRAFPQTAGTRDMDETFHHLATGLRDADRTLVKLKTDYEQWLRQLTPPHQKPIEGSWHYDEPSYSDACTLDKDTFYAYQLLDPITPSREALQAPIVIADSALFQVDVAMADRGIAAHYKQNVWDLLSKQNPQFIAAISYDSPVVRVCRWDPEIRVMHVQLAAYSDQVVTNHKAALAQDVIVGARDIKIRALAQAEDGQLYPFHESPMSNTIGVCCVIRTCDKYWVMGLRSSSVAFDPGAWGCSASGALNWNELGQWADRSFSGWFTQGIMREAAEELGYTARPGEVSYLGLAREFGRAGKPQVFFLIESRSSCKEIAAGFRTYREANSEYQRIEFINDRRALDLIGRDEAKVNAVCGDSPVGEELRFNLALAMHRVAQG